MSNYLHLPISFSILGAGILTIYAIMEKLDLQTYVRPVTRVTVLDSKLSFLSPFTTEGNEDYSEGGEYVW